MTAPAGAFLVNRGQRAAFAVPLSSPVSVNVNVDLHVHVHVHLDLQVNLDLHVHVPEQTAEFP